jgi:hypothetical protein
MEQSEASVTSSIRRAREVERGVGSGVPRGGGRKRERGGRRGRQSNRGVRMAPGSAVEGGIARSRRGRWRTGEGGGVWVTWCGVTDRWVGRQRGPVSATGCGRERGK